MKLSKILCLSSLLIVGNSGAWASEIDLQVAEPPQKRTAYKTGFMPTSEKVLKELEIEKQKTAHKMGFTSYSIPSTKPLPETFDLMDHIHFIFDQGALGSCTANSIAIAFSISQSVQLKRAFPTLSDSELKKLVVTLSRLELYYKEREIEGTIDRDEGASIGSGLLALYRQGVCSEDKWPYEISKFRDTPPASATAHDKDNRDLDGIDHDQLLAKGGHFNLYEFKKAIVEGNAISMGIKLRKSFMSDAVASTGNVPFNLPNDDVEGWHAVTCIGYTPTHLMFVNSWSDQWGMKGKGSRGFFKVPKDFLTPDNVSEAWKIGKVTLPKVNTHPIVHSVTK